MKGITTYDTPLGWHVFRLHYSADETKDPARKGKEWYARTRKGVKERDWRKEFEIDFQALGGQLLFPEFDRSVHVTPPRWPLDPNYWTVYLGCDPHPRRAHSFCWLATNRHGDMVVPFSYWPESLNQEREEHGEGRLTIAGEDGYAAKLKMIAAGPLGLESYLEVMDSAGKNFDAAEGVDFFQQYADCGIHFYPAKKNRDGAGWNAISEVLRLKPYEGGRMKPTLTIWLPEEGDHTGTCGDNAILIEQLEKLRFREFRGTVLDKDAPQEPEQKDRHLVEALMYVLLFGPEYFENRKRRSTFEPTIRSCAY